MEHSPSAQSCTYYRDGLPLSLAIEFGRMHCLDVEVAVVGAASEQGQCLEFGFFVIGAAGLDVGSVVVAAVVTAIHEYLGFGIDSRMKKCALTFDGLFSVLWEVRAHQNSVAHSLSDSVAMGNSQLAKCYTKALVSDLVFINL